MAALLGTTTYLSRLLRLHLGAGMLLAASHSSALGSASYTVQWIDGRAQSAWFLCDALNAQSVVVGSLPDASRRVRLTSYSKAQPSYYQYQTYTLGKSQTGGGSTIFPLIRGSASQKAVGSLALANLGPPTGPERAFTPPYLMLETEHLHTGCRWLAGTLVSGFTPWRSFVITQSSTGDLTYQTFDFKNAANAQVVDIDGAQRSSQPSMKISGGERKTTASAQLFSFKNAGYTYVLKVPTGKMQGTLLVMYGGRIVLQERVSGYVLSALK